MVFLSPLIQVQDLVILAEAVAVEIAVRVIEQDVFRVQIRQFPIARDRLLERCRLLERKALFAQCVTCSHPSAGRAAAGTAVAFVDQNEVVAFERVDGDRFVALFIA